LKPLLQIHQSSTLDKDCSMVISKDCTMVWVYRHTPYPNIEEDMEFTIVLIVKQKLEENCTV
jgi:hypothetical protein